MNGVVILAYVIVIILLAVLLAVTLAGWLMDMPRLDAHHTEIPEYHVVEHGDTLWDIANHYWPGQHTGRRVHDIVMLNDLANEPFIYPGQRLRLVQSANDTL